MSKPDGNNETATTGNAARILIVETGTSLVETIHTALRDDFPANLDLAGNMDSVRHLLERHGEDYFIAVADVNPEKGDCEAMVELILDHGVPLILLCGEPKDEHVKRLLDMGALDCVNRNVPASAQYVERTIRRLHGNLASTALVVDDSPTYRQMVGSFLENHLFTVIEAQDGAEALSMMEKHPEIRLAIVDHEMPGMDGFTLITELRRCFETERLAIIGLSGSEKQGLGVAFIKFGADDFIAKPFEPDEFLVRINDTMNKQDMVRELTERASTDCLTQLFNRNHFFETAAPLYANAKRGNLTLAVAMIDIDFFKKVNDTYGHLAGDEVLRRVSALLTERTRETDLVARIGGEEFCFLAVNPEPDQVKPLFEEIREIIEAATIDYVDDAIKVTASIGVATKLGKDLNAMLNAADEALYAAKNGGRNRVVMAGT